MTSAVWMAVLVGAALWPSRWFGPLDGAPLDRPIEIVAIVLLLPALWFLDPGFLRRPTARALVAVLAVWKIATWLLAAQTGWCGLFLTAHEPAIGGYRFDRSWDARTFWSGTPAACSAIVTRGFALTRDFPGWIVNVPFGPDHDFPSGVDTLPVENRQPPRGVYAMALDGYMYSPEDGVLSFERGPQTAIRGSVDGRPIPETSGAAPSVPLDRGAHQVSVWLDLEGPGWRFVPTWNGVPLFDAVATSLLPQTAVSRVLASWGRWVPALIIVAIVIGWSVDAVRTLNAGWPIWAWCVASTAAVAACAFALDDSGMRVAPALLLGGALVPVPERARTIRSAFVAFGLAWITFHVARMLSEVGRFWLFTVGDDPLSYQRYAYNVFFQGEWLRGGEGVFRWQPLYRWVVGLLHLVFGDSSVGETYLDAAALLAGALLAFEFVRRLAGYRAGVAAGVLTLLTVTAGPCWYLIGRGLSDVTAAGFIYCAAFALLDAREDGVARSLLAGACAVLAYWTRLNHLPLIVAMVVLLLPDPVATGRWYRIRDLWMAVPVSRAVAYLAVVAAGLAAFSLRGRHYTGELHLLGGVGMARAATGLGTSAGSFLSMNAWGRALESVLMIATIQDPPRFDPRAALVAGGVLAAVAAFIGVPVARRLPLRLCAFCLASLAFGFAVRGIGYHGRFSVHLIPIAVAVSVAALSMSTIRDVKRPL